MVLGDNGRHHSISVGDGSLFVNHTVKNEVLHRCPTGSPLAVILKHLNKGTILNGVLQGRIVLIGEKCHASRCLIPVESYCCRLGRMRATVS